MKIAVIPARGGSKRVPRKNIRLFNGKPMIAWSIDAAKASGCFDEIFVSTEDLEIKELAEGFGATIIDRPAELADDQTPLRPVVNHAIKTAGQRGREIEYVCSLLATAPLLAPAWLVQGLQQLHSSGAHFVFSAVRFSYPIQRALKLDESGHVRMCWPEHRLTRSQDLPMTFHDAGQFYWGRAEGFLAGRETFAPGSEPMFLPSHRVQDIDTEEDWVRAEALARALELSGEGR